MKKEKGGIVMKTVKRKYLIGFLALIGIGVVAFGSTIAYLKKPYHDESANYHNQKNVILAFIKPTCMHCNSIRTKINGEKIFHDIIVIDVTKTKNAKLMDKFSISGTPTLVNINKSGKVYKYKGTDKKEINKLINY